MQMKKKALALLLSLIMIFSLFGGTTLVSAAEEDASAQSSLFFRANAMEAGKEYVIATQSGEDYYALTCNNGTLGATKIQVTIKDGDAYSVSADTTATWKLSEGNYLESVSTPGQFIFAGSGGFMVYGSSMLRNFLYGSDQKVALNNGKYYLTFDGTKFGQGTVAEAATILVFEKYTGFVLADSLTKGYEYVIAAKNGDKYYALGLKDSAYCMTEITVADDMVAAQEDAYVWIPDGKDNLESKGTRKTYVYAGSYGFMTYSSGRAFLYDADAKTVKLHTKYYLTFNGTKFDQSEKAADAASILIFCRAAEAEEDGPPKEYPQPDAVKRTAVANADGSITLAFTSDVHYDGKNLNLKTWLEASDISYIDSFGFCGDMGSAYASNAEDFWTWTDEVVDYVDTLIDDGTVGTAVYTLGNHEWFPRAGGDYANNYDKYDSAKRLKQVGEGVVTDKYIIYCFGAGEIAATNTYDYNKYDIAALDEYLNTAPKNIPIFILTHFPLHIWGGRGEERYMEHGADVIDVLNAHSDLNLIVLWGHNHSNYDDNYYQPKFPSDKITIDPQGTVKELKFSYLAAGCTADWEYTSPSAGSAATMNKGLIVTIGADGKLDYNYYTLDGEKMPIKSPWLVRFRAAADPKTQFEFFATQYVTDGNTVTSVDAPEIEGYEFNGSWTTWRGVDGVASEVEFDFSEPITKNTLITAHYDKVILPVTPAAKRDPAYVYVTILDEQAAAVGKSGATIALYPVPYVKDMTVGDAFIKAHELEYEGGLDGVETYDTTYGFWSFKKLWGHTPANGSLAFDPNETKCYIDTSAKAVAGASYYALAYDESSEWISTSYMNSPSVEVWTGETVTMAALTFAMDSSYNYAQEGMPGDVYCGTGFDDLKKVSSTKDGFFELSFDEPGDYIAVVKGEKGDAIGFISVVEPFGYRLADTLEAGIDSLIVTEFDGAYYALSFDGETLGATEVKVSDDLVLTKDDTVVWTLNDKNALESMNTPGQFIFAGSSGRFQTYDNSMLRTFAYDGETDTVLLHSGAYYLTFDGEKFGHSNSATDISEASTILVFSRSNLDTYTITFKSGVDGIEDKSDTKLEGQDYEINETMTRSGYTFDGWNTEEDGSGSSYAVGDLYTENADLVLYAQWKKNSSSGGGGSSGGSGSGSKNDSNGSAEPEAEEDIIITTPDVDSGEAKSSVEKDAVTEVLENREDNTLIVKVVTDNADNVEVTLTTEAIKAVSDADAQMLVETEMGTVKLDTDTVTALAEDGKNVTVAVKANEDGTTMLSVTVGDEPADVKVKVELPAPEDSQVLVVVLEDGTEEVIKKSLVEDGKVYAEVPAGATVKVIENKKTFSDVKDTDWFSDAVTFASSHELFQGVKDGEFAPNSPMTRAMLVTVLYRLEDEPNTEGAVSFDDVNDGSWYADAVAWASEAGIVQGTGNGFDPNANVTREQIATILYRYAQQIGIDTSAKGDVGTYGDGDEVSAWAKDAMAWAVSVGLFQGDDNGNLNPSSDATRAEVATLVARMVKLIVK